MLTRTSSSGRRRRASVPRRRQSQDGGTNTKKASFNPRVQYHAVPYLSDIDKAGVWYTSNEYSTAREREEFIRKKVSENDALFRKNEENLIAQGILTNQGVLSKIQAVDYSIIAVLDEQDGQEVKFQLSQNKTRKSKKRSKSSDTVMMFSVNDEKIAKVYRSHSNKALKEAQNRALRHEKHLKDIASDPSIPSPSFSPARVSKKKSPRRVPKSATTLATTKTKNPLMRRALPPLAAVEDVPQALRCTNPAA